MIGIATVQNGQRRVAWHTYSQHGLTVSPGWRLNLTQAVFDIETMLPWQQQLFTGMRQGEMMIMMSGRHTGKSQMAAYARMFDDILAARPVTDIQLGEGTVYGARYYTAQPEGGNWKEMEAWCSQTYGAHGGAIWGADPNKAPLPSARWYMNNRKFWFRKEQDRDWFLIKWRS